MNTVISVRKANHADAQLIASFAAAMALETEGNTLDIEIARQASEAVLRDPLLGFYLVAVKSEEPVGSLLITFEWSDWRNAMRWWIQSVFVVSTHRGTGVYRQLYKEVQRLAQQAGNVCGVRLYVEQNNCTAQTTYRKLGMTQAPYLIFEAEID